MNVMPRFEFIGFHNTDKGFVIDGFALFANVIAQTKDTVTYERYMDFGKIKSKKPVTVSVTDFKKYYVPLTDEIYNRCLEAQANECKDKSKQ